MNTLHVTDVALAGFFLFAAIHYGIKWWFSRAERVLLVFAIQCAAYTVFSFAMSFRNQATTIAEAQTVIDLVILLGAIVHAILLQFYAHLARRRDLVFRVIVSGALVGFAVLSQFVPIRGTVVALQEVQLPGGGTTLLPIRTAPGVPLVAAYVVMLVVQLYGLFVSRMIWRAGDRVGAALVALGVATVEAGALIAVGVDFFGLRAPYAGALPHAVFVICMAVFIAREYSARAKRVIVANTQFETVFEHAPIGMALLAADGGVLRVNHAFSDMFGRSGAELCTRRLQDLTDLTVLDGYSGETSFRRANGEQAWALAALSSMPGDTRVVAQMQDVTELRAHRTKLEELVAQRTFQLREAKEEAERANAIKSKFLAHVSHEIRTPLGVMMLYAQILQRDEALGAAQLAKLDTIMSSGQHLMMLLSDVLEISKIEATRAALVEASFDIWAMLDEIERMYSAQAACQGIALRIDRNSALPHTLLGDGGKVKQVLINLVSNGVKFTNRGAVSIHASAIDKGDDELLVTMRVVDTGIGISPADLERLFSPFEQLAPAAVAGGTGLGLAISLGYARLMRGDIAVESKVDVGTTFAFTFVAKRGQAVEVKPPAADRVVTKECKILVVDDLKQNRDVLVALLAHPLYETRTASNGPSALEIHASWLPDLVLVDLRMPDMDGVEVVRRMRGSGSKAAIGMISASALAKDEQEALAVGADFFMRKPYDERDLFERIDGALARR